MKRPFWNKIIRVLLVFFFLSFALGLVTSGTLHAVEIMKLSEVKTGMTGEGKTIFKGTKIESFPFKVLGIVEKFVPGKNLIMIQMDSPILNETSLIAGMSGSPAYINGKLVGAIAYGFGFAKTAIGGITPIEDIIETTEYNRPAVSVDLSNIKLEFDKKNVEYIARRVFKELTNRVNFTPASGLMPIKLMGAHRGLTREALDRLTPIFSPMSVVGLSGGKADSADQLQTGSLSGDPLKISPADAVTIPLIKGDFEFSSLGTVTHVDGDNVFMFGHPFYNLGSVDFPMHKAEIITVVPSYNTSFKISATRNMVGRVVQDRYSAVMGEVGKLPYMIPLNVYLKNMDKKFDLEMVNHQLLTPVLSAVAMTSIFSAQYQELGFQSIKVNGKIYIEGEKNVIIDDLYSGSDSFNEFSNLLLAVNFFLLNNKEKNIKIQKMDFEIAGSNSVLLANIENVLTDKKSYLPGEIINITVFLRNEKGSPFIETLSITAPDLKAGSELYLLVADSSEIGRFESKNVRTNYFPSKLNFLIRAINNLRKNNRLYLKMMTPTRGMFVKGYEYPNLPSSLQNMFMKERTHGYNDESGMHAPIKFSTISEYQMEFPTVVRGKKLFKLKIKERSDGQ